MKNNFKVIILINGIINMRITKYNNGPSRDPNIYKIYDNYVNENLWANGKKLI